MKCSLYADLPANFLTASHSLNNYVRRQILSSWLLVCINRAWVIIFKHGYIQNEIPPRIYSEHAGKDLYAQKWPLTLMIYTTATPWQRVLQSLGSSSQRLQMRSLITSVLPSLVSWRPANWNYTIPVLWFDRLISAEERSEASKHFSDTDHTLDTPVQNKSLQLWFHTQQPETTHTLDKNVAQLSILRIFEGFTLFSWSSSTLPFGEMLQLCKISFFNDEDK